MGALTKLIDVLLFLYFLFIAITAPLTDALAILPTNLLPPILLDLKNLYIKEFDDYLFAEKPHFFVGIIWVELLFQWPLAVSCVYGLAASKSWFKITSLIYGASSFTGLVSTSIPFFISLLCTGRWHVVKEIFWWIFHILSRSRVRNGILLIEFRFHWMA